MIISNLCMQRFIHNITEMSIKQRWKNVWYLIKSTKGISDLRVCHAVLMQANNNGPAFEMSWGSLLKEFFYNKIHRKPTRTAFKNDFHSNSNFILRRNFFSLVFDTIKTIMEILNVIISIRTFELVISIKNFIFSLN